MILCSFQTDFQICTPDDLKWPSPPRKNRPHWGGKGRSKASWEYRPLSCLFWQKEFAFISWLGVNFRYGQPNNIWKLLDVAYGKIHSYRKKFEKRIRWMRSLGVTAWCNREFKHNMMWVNFGFKFYFYFLCFKVARYHTLPQPCSKV